MVDCAHKSSLTRHLILKCTFQARRVIVYTMYVLGIFSDCIFRLFWLYGIFRLSLHYYTNRKRRTKYKWQLREWPGPNRCFSALTQTIKRFILLRYERNYFHIIHNIQKLMEKIVETDAK